MSDDLILPLPDNPDVLAPDGLEVRILHPAPGLSTAHFKLGAGMTGRAVQHKTITEIWHFTRGSGTLWRKINDVERIETVKAGDTLKIHPGTSFQFKADATDLEAFAITTPPWPGDDEAIVITGRWAPSL